MNSFCSVRVNCSFLPSSCLPNRFPETVGNSCKANFSNGELEFPSTLLQISNCHQVSEILPGYSSQDFKVSHRWLLMGNLCTPTTLLHETRSLQTFQKPLNVHQLEHTLEYFIKISELFRLVFQNSELHLLFPHFFLPKSKPHILLAFREKKSNSFPHWVKKPILWSNKYPYVFRSILRIANFFQPLIA